mgnify:CR=1 FL=1
MRIPIQSSGFARRNTATAAVLDGVSPSRWPPRVPNVPVPGAKHTYCCKYGPSDDPEQHCRQFRSTSAQAPLLCLRIARGCPDCGGGNGRLSRGECDC